MYINISIIPNIKYELKKIEYIFMFYKHHGSFPCRKFLS